MIKEGMLVKYAAKWCRPEEQHLRHIVLENRLNPVTGKATRWLIQTVNTNLSLPPQEVVEEEMIEPAE